ncbi:neuralized-like protein 4 [Pomacea canaliculata]|uniref:neuralized-like protein 4 n=1 Tax=Pomacea canaliculata TaxID=400727 RepID=UPI000D736587|nr:neuralized-like protein 4 [Pomacea canaliculata]
MLEQAIGQVTSRLQKIDVSEQKDMAQVDKACDRLHKLVEDVCNKLKDKSRTSHLQVRNSLRDVKTALSNRVGKVTSHKHIVTRAAAVSPRPALIHMTQALTDRVNSLDVRANLQREVWVEPLSSVECFEELVRRIVNELPMWKQQKTESKLVTQAAVLVFHQNCGKNIRLTNGNRTAEKIGTHNVGDGVVVSRDRMLANVLYEVRVDAGTNVYNNLALGVTRISPAHLAVKQWSEDLQDSVIIGTGEVYYQRKCMSIPLGEDLTRLEVGSRVGVLVTSSNDLHLYINGQDQGVAAKNVTQPWFAVFSIGSSVSKVTALPPSWTT